MSPDPARLPEAGRDADAPAPRAMPEPDFTGRPAGSTRGAWQPIWSPAESPLQRMLRAPLVPLAAAYAAGAWLHRTAYARGWLARVRLPARVVSVGNLTVGGSGKTPTAGWIAAALHARGHRVALLCRGVGGARMHEVNVVSDGTTLFMAPYEVGDEPVWLATTAPGVPVLAGRNRVALGLRAVAAFGAETLVLDDGFQHHRLVRDLDLVCVDATLGLGNRRTLPRGPLREPVSALRRASAILFTRVPTRGAGEGGTPDIHELPVGLPQGGLGAGGPTATPPSRASAEWDRQRRLLQGLSAPRFALAIEPAALRRLGTSEPLPLDSLQGRSVGVLAAVARPQQVTATIERLGGRVIVVRTRSDHHMYTRLDIESLDPDLRWVTTAKDAIKIPPEWAKGREIDVIEETVQPLPGADPITWLLDRLGPERG